MTERSTDGAAAPLGAADAKKIDRRDFVANASSVAMAGGLIAGYGALGALAGRYLFQDNDDTAWLFVAAAASIKPGDSLSFESPVGVRVVLTRRSKTSTAAPPSESDFLALSSVCPHLGCRVHWEGQNDRFFCPCHNGTFDPSGKATGGPPLAAAQSLPKYPLKIERGMLFIRLPIRSVGDVGRSVAESASEGQGILARSASEGASSQRLTCKMYESGQATSMPSRARRASIGFSARRTTEEA